MLVVLAVAGMSAISPIPSPEGFASLESHGLLLGVLATILAVALGFGAWGGVHVAGVATIDLGVHCLPGVGGTWPLTLVIVLALYAGLLGAFGPLRRRVDWFVRGRIDRVSVLLAVSFTVLAAIALVLWRFTSGADMTRYRAFVPTDIATPWVFLGLIPFAALNAAFEEILWRGALWRELERPWGRAAALVITSVSFGLAHARGFPSGVVGVGLATIYGVMMGIIRMRTRGLLGPWAAHVIADVVIYAMVVAMVVGR